MSTPDRLSTGHNGLSNVPGYDRAADAENFSDAERAALAGYLRFAIERLFKDVQIGEAPQQDLLSRALLDQVVQNARNFGQPIVAGRYAAIAAFSRSVARSHPGFKGYGKQSIKTIALQLEKYFRTPRVHHGPVTITFHARRAAFGAGSFALSARIAKFPRDSGEKVDITPQISQREILPMPEGTEVDEPQKARAIAWLTRFFADHDLKSAYERKLRSLPVNRVLDHEKAVRAARFNGPLPVLLIIAAILAACGLAYRLFFHASEYPTFHIHHGHTTTNFRWNSQAIQMLDKERKAASPWTRVIIEPDNSTLRVIGDHSGAPIVETTGGWRMTADLPPQWLNGKTPPLPVWTDYGPIPAPPPSLGAGIVTLIDLRRLPAASLNAGYFQVFVTLDNNSPWALWAEPAGPLRVAVLSTFDVPKEGDHTVYLLMPIGDERRLDQLYCKLVPLKRLHIARNEITELPLSEDPRVFAQTSAVLLDAGRNTPAQLIVRHYDVSSPLVYLTLVPKAGSTLPPPSRTFFVLTGKKHVFRYVSESFKPSGWQLYVAAMSLPDDDYTISVESPDGTDAALLPRSKLALAVRSGKKGFIPGDDAAVAFFGDSEIAVFDPAWREGVRRRGWIQGILALTSEVQRQSHRGK